MTTFCPPTITSPAPPGGHRCTERTVITDDRVALAVRDYTPIAPTTDTVILLPGLCLTQLSWQNQIRRLQRGAGLRIISYDHRGHGNSTSAPLHTYTTDRLAADLAAVLAAVEVTGSTTLAGHSMGGMCALSYLAREPADQPVQPAGLVLIATAAGHLTDHGLGRLLATPGLDTLIDLIDHAPHRAAEHAVRALAAPLCAALSRRGGYGPAERSTLAAVAADAVHSTPWATAVGFLLPLKTFDQQDILHRITAATTVVSGGADVLTPPAHARTLARTIPGASHVHHPTAGHMLLHEASRAVTDAITATISATHTGARRMSA